MTQAAGHGAQSDKIDIEADDSRATPFEAYDKRSFSLRPIPGPTQAHPRPIPGPSQDMPCIESIAITPTLQPHFYNLTCVHLKDSRPASSCNGTFTHPNPFPSPLTPPQAAPAAFLYQGLEHSALLHHLYITNLPRQLELGTVQISQSSSLRLHHWQSQIRWHGEMRPQADLYPCLAPGCGRSFTTESGLRVHHNMIRL